jgi:hypothetical protein
MYPFDLNKGKHYNVQIVYTEKEVNSSTFKKILLQLVYSLDCAFINIISKYFQIIFLIVIKSAMFKLVLD